MDFSVVFYTSIVNTYYFSNKLYMYQVAEAFGRYAS